MRAISAFRLLRPKQWAKGFLIFAALLFTRSYTDPERVRLSLLAFAAMCLVSSAVYVFNDLQDVTRDQNHPVKKHRPLASGAVSVPVGLSLGVLCLASGIAIAVQLGGPSLALIGVYLGIQAGYNLGLKHIAVLDVFLVSSGFVLRAALGAAAIQVTISGWLLLCTGALALLLGFAKRRHEFVLQGDARSSSRESLESYTREALDALVIIAASVSAICYGLYALESPTAYRYPGLFGTTAFVFYGIARYTFLAFSKGEVGEPESVVLGDPHMVLAIFGFLVTAALALSGYSIPFVEVGRP
ncbi:MAG: UbiA prenyltransferase family protein [Fimbriimonas sp.]